MKLISGIYNDKQLNKYLDFIDGAILMVPHFSLVYEDLDLNKAISKMKKLGKTIILSLNKIFTEDEIDEAYKFLDEYKNEEVLFYVADLGLIKYAKDNNILDKIIYNPETMITNYLDLSVYMGFNLDAYGISNEITIEDLKTIYDKTKAPLFYLGFGKRLMFYSKRKLLSLYKEKYQTKFSFDDLYLKEETRDDKYKIIENNNGTMIYRSYFISLHKELDDLLFLKYFYIDPLDLEEDDYLNALSAYHDYLYNIIGHDEFIKKIDSLNLNISDGFAYNDSVYQKEDLKNG
ncbi:MAG: U32 family peptidase [Acholeplasmatales bacterium]|nr:U32 family peptidase [Acholeplasmatales bacterium]